MANELTLTDMGDMAKAFAQSGFFGYKNSSEAFTLMCLAQANGLHPAKAAERYHIIQGRPAMKADAMLAAFQESGGKVRWVKRTEKECTLHLSHPQGGELDVTWSIDRATKAGLTGKSIWNQYPTQMLSARCVSEGVRALYPACLCGMYTPEEVADFYTKPAPQQTACEVVDDNVTVEVVDKNKNKEHEQQTELGTPAEDYNTQTAPLFPEESDEDKRKKADFVKAMAQLKASHEETYTHVMGSLGYEAASEVPASERRKVFKAIQAEINKEADNGK